MRNFVLLLGLWMVGLCRFAPAEINKVYPFIGCAPVFQQLSEHFEKHGRLPDEHSIVLQNPQPAPWGMPEYDFSHTPFYDPKAIYIGVKANSHGIHMFTIVRNRRLDGWAKERTLLPSADGGPPPQSWKEIGDFVPPKGWVPPASYGLIFKIPADERTLNLADAAMEKTQKTVSTGDCVTPVLEFLEGTGFTVPRLDMNMNPAGKAETLLEALLHGKLRHEQEEIKPAILFADRQALAKFTRDSVAGDKLIHRQWMNGKLWDPQAPHGL